MVNREHHPTAQLAKGLGNYLAPVRRNHPCLAFPWQPGRTRGLDPRGLFLMGEKSPAFQFYPRDFLSDEKQAVMTNAESGAYMRLLCHCWLEGSIPNDQDRLARLVGTSPEDFAGLWPNLEPCFQSNGNGRLVNPRIEVERKKQEHRRKQARKAGKRSAEVRWGQQYSNDRYKSVVTDRNPSSSTASSTTSSEKKGISGSPGKADPLESEFQPIWEAYPKRSGGNPKAKAFKAYRARRKAHAMEAIRDGVVRYAKWCEATQKVGTEYVKQAATFFGPDEHFLERWEIGEQPLNREAQRIYNDMVRDL